MDPHHGWNVSFKPVVWGFCLSLLLTLAAYFLVTEQLLVGWALVTALVGCALVQGIGQLIFYLHLGVEQKPRWNLMIFLFMILIMVVIIAGSIWIMRMLDYNLMPGMRHG